MRPAVKFCGICSAADARAAASAGADYAGVILAPGYRRSQTVQDAARILHDCTAERVGVFIDQPVAHMLDAVERLGLAVIQLHGDEDPAQVEALRGAATRRNVPMRIWKTLHANRISSLDNECRIWTGIADGILLDAGAPDARGGTGLAFDWERASRDVSHQPRSFQLIAAGGLTPDNVAAAVALLAPDVVDVSSGIEDGSGAKSPARMHAFVAAVRALRGAPSGNVE